MSWIRLRLAPAGLLLTVSVGVAAAQPRVSFSEQVYPMLQKAGCQTCHFRDGVASATRLRFPDDDAPRAAVEAFGRSLVEFVDRQEPSKSLLWKKPTLRIAHTGGERIKRGSREESLWNSWTQTLAKLPDAEVRKALDYRKTESPQSAAQTTVALRRLTHQQYSNTIQDLLKETTDASSNFPPEDYVDGFKNQYRSQSLSPVQIEMYSQSAERLVKRAFLRGDSRHLLPCPIDQGNAKCADEFIANFGRRAFRRPLDPREIALYSKIFKSEPNFVAGVQTVMESMLQAPAFLFWMQQATRQEGKPYATASRLSYLLWNTMPDDALLDAAAKGNLDTPQGVEGIAREMLTSPKARTSLDEFVSQWLRFDRALGAARERRTFPQFSRDLVLSMLEESRRFVGDLVWNNKNFMDLFRAEYGFVNSDLASIYKVPAPARDFDRVDFPRDQERAGILGQGTFLTLTSKPEDTAPTSRGLFIREQFLCQQVPPPPQGVDTNLPPVSEFRPVTNRERLKEHTTNPSCASCHSLIDPLGFGLEKFDAIGVRREKAKLLFYPDVHEAKIPKKTEELDLDISGKIAGLENSEFTNSREMGEILASSAQCQECVVRQVFRYMAGRRDTPEDAPLIRAVLDDFRRSGFQFQQLLVSLVKADGSAPKAP